MTTSAPTTAPRTTEDNTVETPLLLTVEQAAKRLGIGRTLTYTLINRGDIESVCIGRLRRIRTDALAAYTQRLAADQHTQPEAWKGGARWDGNRTAHRASTAVPMATGTAGSPSA